MRIAANALADRWQRNAKQVEVATDSDALDQHAGTCDQVERRAMLFQLVERLPDDQRLVIQRRFVDGKSVREISQELGRSEGAVKQLQFRAMETLRDTVRSNHE